MAKIALVLAAGVAVLVALALLSGPRSNAHHSSQNPAPRKPRPARKEDHRP